MKLDGDPQLNRTTYEWSARVFTIVKKFLRVSIKLHGSRDQVGAGEIFVFNHFARFETFIPQYLIYQETGALCRSVAASDFFVEGSPLSNYLLDLGAVPNNYPRLFPFLAEEILRGRKVVIFPEGGMVKDRQVMDSSGEYGVYSRMAGSRRRQHTGAAVLALVLDAFKMAVLGAHAAGKTDRVEAWAQRLGQDSAEALLSAARRPTLIVPSNITFYPIRVNENVLRKGAELLLNRRLDRRLSEELLIEGNILFKDTDMDVRLGNPVKPTWTWWERKLFIYLGYKTDPLEEFFKLTRDGRAWNTPLMTKEMRRKAGHIRDGYMREMYSGVSVNLSHLASQIMLKSLNRHQSEIERALFYKILYLAVKNVQKRSLLHLHRSLRNPAAYGGVIDGQCPGLAQFLETTMSMGLVGTENGHYRFLPKLSQKPEFDEIRRENLVVVYANEVAPISAVTESVEQAIEGAPTFDDRDLARMRFDDELVAHAWDRQRFSKPRYHEINRQETATASGEPFLFLPDEGNDLGVVLVHGLLASPAEVRSFGAKLKAAGYPVIGVRLKGHGTSPWDLREQKWQDWLEAVRRGHAIMSAFARHICLVGFSTGGALSLRLAAESPERLAGVAAISVPLRFHDRNMIFVPLVHSVNRLVQWASSFEGVMPFRPRDSEHPHINYRNVPIRSLYELQRLIGELEECLAKVQCPVTLIQGTEDPIVDAKSAELIFQRLGAARKNLIRVPATRHGILNEDIGDTQQSVLSFLQAISTPD